MNQTSTLLTFGNKKQFTALFKRLRKKKDGNEFMMTLPLQSLLESKPRIKHSSTSQNDHAVLFARLKIRRFLASQK